MKLANCLRILFAVAFVVGVLSSSHAAQKGIVISPDAAGVKVQPDRGEVAPEKAIPEKLMPEKKKPDTKTRKVILGVPPKMKPGTGIPDVKKFVPEGMKIVPEEMKKVPRNGSQGGFVPKKPSSTVKFQTHLSVKLGGGDFSQWGTEWKDNSPQVLNFRWKTPKGTNEFSGKWQISRSANFNANTILNDGDAGMVPEQGEYQWFSIDFRAVVAEYYNIIPVTFYVRLVPISDSELYIPSEPVKVLIGEAGNTQFIQRKLHVVFDKIHVIDDSDELSEGELHFSFWVGNTGPKVHGDQVDSGEDTNVGVSFVIEDPPGGVTLKVFGCDWDDLTSFNSSTCGDDPDTAEQSITIGTLDPFTKMELLQSDQKPFTMDATGSELEFVVYGRYWLTPQ